jgi:hypothetical protein
MGSGLGMANSILGGLASGFGSGSAIAGLGSAIANG